MRLLVVEDEPKLRQTLSQGLREVGYTVENCESGEEALDLMALSSFDMLMRNLMNYRFENGNLKGHSFGNLLLSALEKVTGSFDEAVEKASESRPAFRARSLSSFSRS